jgi:hypothetical protein
MNNSKEEYQKRVDLYNLSPKICKQCKRSLIYQDRRKMFCNLSCAATYNNLRKPKIKRQTLSCLQCQNTIEFCRASRMLFCSIECHALYKWNTISLPRIKSGNASGTLIKKYYILTNNKCFECSLGPTWNYKPLTLQLDHIDGNSDNNILENTRLLCPNCHTQTPIWCKRCRQ